MDFMAVVEERRSIRKYRPDPVPQVKQGQVSDIHHPIAVVWNTQSDFSAIGIVQAKEQTRQRCFAAAGPPQQAQNRAWLKSEGKIVQDKVLGRRHR